MTDLPPEKLGLGATYFQPPAGYFWHWAEAAEVVEWTTGTTITYREELLALLSGLAPTGLPPLGAVLLVLAACTDAWGRAEGRAGPEALLRRLAAGGLPNPAGAAPAEEATFHLKVALAFLDEVRKLPAGLRKGTAKEHLLRTVLGDAQPRMPAARAGAVLRQLQPLEPAAVATGAPATLPRLVQELRCFGRAAARFPTGHSLEMQLRTGLPAPPAPLPEPPVPPPAAAAPDLAPAELLARLAQDPRTAGLARLVPPLRAALRLPPLARRPAPDELPLGGVADLSPRGPLSRLLLSELAQDELLLTARLAQGEALYLRPEAPPQPDQPPRALLLDTTLPTWGLPRTLGLAAALALLPPPGPGQPPGLALALTGLDAHPLDLRTPAGVVAALEQRLGPARHCAEALPAALAALPAGAEALLITEAAAARLPAVQAALATAGLRFLLTVDRAGELHLYELAAAGRRPLQRQQVDLNRLLFAKPPRRGPAPAGAAADAPARPAFVRAPLPPLRLPVRYEELLPDTLRRWEGLGVVGLTRNRRLLHWPDPERGAREVLPVVEAGTGYPGLYQTDPPTAHLLVEATRPAGPPRLIFYAVNLQTAQAQRLDLSERLAGTGGWTSIRYGRGNYLLTTPAGERYFDCLAQAFTPELSRKSGQALGPETTFRPAHFSVLQRPARLGLSANGQLVIGNHFLQHSARDLRLTKHQRQPATNLGTTDHVAHHLTGNPRVSFQLFGWPGGAQALTDSRGLLHLRPADPTQPEVTLLLVLDRPTAAWASDGATCGPDYFTGNPATQKDGATFYARYIQPFIEALRRTGEFSIRN